MKKFGKAMDRLAWKARSKMMNLATKAKAALENEDGDTNFISIAIILVVVLVIAIVFISLWSGTIKPLVTNTINNFTENFENL